MRRVDLAIGDEVFVCLPYGGGKAWGHITALDAAPEGKPTNTVRIAFLPGTGPRYRHDDHPVALREIVRRKDR